MDNLAHHPLGHKKKNKNKGKHYWWGQHATIKTSKLEVWLYTSLENILLHDFIIIIILYMGMI